MWEGVALRPKGFRLGLGCPKLAKASRMETDSQMHLGLASVLNYGLI
jgi:hypothetical protein